MYPFERFTERATRVLTFAQHEGEASQRSYIGTEHLLFGLLRETDCLAAMVLTDLGVGLDRAREAVGAALVSALPGTQPLPEPKPQQVTRTTRVKRVVEISFDEAQRMGHDYVGTEHLLLGLLIEGEGIGARVLVDMGATLDRVREDIDRFLEATAAEMAAPWPRTDTTAPMPVNSPPLRALLFRARTRAAAAGSPIVGLEHLLEETMASTSGAEALARLLDVRRTAALREHAADDHDAETAARHQAEGQALQHAVAAWREELDPPEPSSAS
jgi:ATP-dependent Clp protease ATP-binding subunit ClpC